MINLLQETMHALDIHGKTTDDVLWVGIKKLSWPWEDFAKIADFEYDNRYGGREINEFLVIGGDNWWLVREENGGSEVWVFEESYERSNDAGIPLTIELIVKNPKLLGAL